MGDQDNIRTPEFWRKMRRKFRKLDPDGRLWISWSYFPARKKHYFTDECDITHKEIAADFNALATRCGLIASSSAPHDAWLVQLRLRSPNDRPGSDILFEPETMELLQCISGIIRRPCYESEVLCLLYERRALEGSLSPSAPREKRNESSIADQLNELADDFGVSHEGLAAKIRIGKTTYFAVKAGKGGRASRQKVIRYLHKHLKNQ